MSTLRKPVFVRVAIIGLGLIGGSLAKAVKKRGLAEQVVGCDLRASEWEEGLNQGVVDQAFPVAADAVRGADLVVIAVPVQATESVLQEIRDHLPETAVLTDVGSVKGSFVEAVRRVFGDLSPRVIPGHPIAGSEKSGITAANDQLFENHKVILTPAEDADPQALAALRALWEGCGAEVLSMPVSHHDEVLAATSHLPHLIAFSLVDTLAGEDDNKEIFRYAAGGFRDFTRIAASDPVMWRDIFMANRDAVLKVLDHFNEDLGQLREAIEQADGQRLMQVFTRAKAAREHFSRLLSGQAYFPTMTTKKITYLARPGGKVSGDIRVPGDKSMSHRAIMLGALATGMS